MDFQGLQVLRFLCAEAVDNCPNGNKELNDPQTRQNAVVAISFVIRSTIIAIDEKKKRILRETSTCEESISANGSSNELKSDSQALENIQSDGKDRVTIGESDKSINITVKKVESGVVSPAASTIAEDRLPMEAICECLEIASADYQFDRRGDVGSWVREAAIEVIAYLLETLRINDRQSTFSDPAVGTDHSTIGTEDRAIGTDHSTNDNDKKDSGFPDRSIASLTTAQSLTLFNCILRQAADKFDRTRGRAVFLVYRLLNHSILSQLESSKTLYSDLPTTNSPESRSPSTTKSSRLHKSPAMKPEWIFRRAHYSYSYELTCGKVTRATDQEIEMFVQKQHADASTSTSHSPTTSFPYLPEMTRAFNRIADSKPDLVELSDKGLGAQSCLAPDQVICEDNTIDHLTTELNDDCSDDASADEEDPNKETDLGAFVSWELYHYATQRFQKAGITLKIPEFTRADCVLPHLTPLLIYTPYQHSILAGITNAVGVPLGFVSRSASSALLTLLQSTNDNPKMVNGCEQSVGGSIEIANEDRKIPMNELESWISETLAMVGIEVKKNSGKKQSSTPSTIEYVSMYRGVRFAPVLRTLSVLLQNQLGDLMKSKSSLSRLASLLLTSSYRLCPAILQLDSAIIAFINLSTIKSHLSTIKITVSNEFTDKLSLSKSCFIHNSNFPLQLKDFFLV